ncbi:MAG: hypothetical protein ACRDOU_16320 [Streptosporangiaceae bacterium]
MSVSGREREAASAAIAGPAAVSPRRRAEYVALAVLAVAVLFFCYLRQSSSIQVSSDGSGNILQAWDMLHGNLLLRHWYSSDVSFYTTELPQYALIEALLVHWLGIGAWVVHVGAAMTYTLLVLLAALLAKGRAQGGAGLARALLAAGIMMAPQVSATSILLLSPDHTGTAVPVLVAWLLIDRYPYARPRWLVPLAVGAILAWTMVADSVILITCIAPLVLVVVVRSFANLLQGDGDRASRWYEPSLGGAALIAAGLGTLAPRAIKALGGFYVWRIGTRSAPVGRWPHGVVTMAKGFLELFGANVFDAKTGIALVFAVFHLVGAVLVLWGLGLALRRLFRPDEFIVAVLAVAVVINLGAYMISTHTHDVLGAREMAEVLPFGAALAGRMLGERALGALRARPKALKPALAVLLAASLGALGYGAAQTPAPPANEPLVTWLVGHGFRYGLAGYWEANSTTVASGNRVRVVGVTRTDNGEVTPYQWETNEEDYDPSLHYANFLVAGGPTPLREAKASALLTFGPPQRVYQYDGYIIEVWDTNLLSKLVRFRTHP